MSENLEPFSNITTQSVKKKVSTGLPTAVISSTNTKLVSTISPNFERESTISCCVWLLVIVILASMCISSFLFLTWVRRFVVLETSYHFMDRRNSINQFSTYNKQHYHVDSTYFIDKEAGN